MSKKIFVSYCHEQIDWVLNSLVPCLKASGADVLIDYERFEAGKDLIGQMDTKQDEAEINILVLSPEYLNSGYCVHEMYRAIERDPKFQKGSVIPIKRSECSIPDIIKISNPLYVNLCEDNDIDQWNLLLEACCASLGSEVPDWLSVRDAIIRYLQRNESVNLVVSGNPRWRELINHLRKDFLRDLKIVDLEDPATASRHGLVKEILKACCGAVPDIPIQPEGEDLVELNRILSGRQKSLLALKHFDQVVNRPYYDLNLFSTLRYMVMESRKLVLLVQSRTPFAELLPRDHPLSNIIIERVELNGTS